MRHGIGRHGNRPGIYHQVLPCAFPHRAAQPEAERRAQRRRHSDDNICVDVFLSLTLHQIIKMLSWLRKELLVMLAFLQKRKT